MENIEINRAWRIARAFGWAAHARFDGLEPVEQGGWQSGEVHFDGRIPECLGAGLAVHGFRLVNARNQKRLTGGVYRVQACESGLKIFQAVSLIRT